MIRESVAECPGLICHVNQAKDVTMTTSTKAQVTNSRVPQFKGALPSLTEQEFETPSAGQQFAYRILNPFKNYLLPSGLLKGLMRTSKSKLIEESFVAPGGWRSMELLYRNAPPTDWLDRQALRDNPISMAARNRRKVVTGKLAQLIREQPVDEHVTMLGIGSGPGWHIQTAIMEAGIEDSRVTAYLMDLADDAFSYGQTIANHFKIGDSVNFLTGDARHIDETLPGVHVNIVKLVGIIEYLSDEQLIELLDAVRDVMVPEGRLLTHGLVDRYGTSPFLARVFNLKHRQRDDKALKQILTQRGFKILECEYEPSGIHPIVIAARAD